MATYCIDSPTLQIYICDICQRATPWESGALDCMPGSCDDCFSALHDEAWCPRCGHEPARGGGE